jgi:hypothetical protein
VLDLLGDGGHGTMQPGDWLVFDGNEPTIIREHDFEALFMLHAEWKQRQITDRTVFVVSRTLPSGQPETCGVFDSLEEAKRYGEDRGVGKDNWMTTNRYDYKAEMKSATGELLKTFEIKVFWLNDWRRPNEPSYSWPRTYETGPGDDPSTFPSAAEYKEDLDQYE